MEGSPHLQATMTTENDHAEGNAKGHAQTIEALYELSCWDADTSKPLSDEASSILAELDWINDGSSDDAFQEAVTDYASGMPLSVLVRSGWYTPGTPEGEPGEFEILLSTGGPACRIIGELNRGSVSCQSGHRPTLQHQDWFKPWTDSTYDVDPDALLWFCEQFYYGE